MCTAQYRLLLVFPQGSTKRWSSNNGAVAAHVDIATMYNMKYMCNLLQTRVWPLQTIIRTPKLYSITLCKPCWLINRKMKIMINDFTLFFQYHEYITLLLLNNNCYYTIINN